MRAEWIIIELLAVFVENTIFVFFLYNRFVSKNDSRLHELLLWLILSACGSITLFTGLPSFIYTTVCFIIPFMYLILVKYGKFVHKLLNVIIMHALIIVTSLLGAGVASMLTDVEISHTLLHQDTSRLLALVLIKALQVVVFYLLGRKHFRTDGLKKKSTVLFSFTIIIIFLCLLLLFTGIHEFDIGINQTLSWVAAGLLFILITIFFLYEVFAQEETSNLDLSTRLQRLELETHHFKEIDVMYSDINKWRHEYKNNLIYLRTLAERNDIKKLIDFIDSINAAPMHENNTLRTGNLVLDAVVSSKLWYAQSLGIDVSIHAVYPENNNVKDNDLCAIIGNLFDNAIEACLRIENINKKKFISFSLFVKGKNMTISVSNSYEGLIHRNGSRYITSKDKRFHGIGIQHIDSIVTKYQGHVLREHTDSVFESLIIIPLVIPQEEN
ncbi:MAG: GHKL domain-containing protein [Oscillospiraceae bacterium]|jgi:sensor histidine kinase YesM|nr:GHKL domain-containing protein [Oscillospiraceae bacterium]